MNLVKCQNDLHFRTEGVNHLVFSHLTYGNQTGPKCDSGCIPYKEVFQLKRLAQRGMSIAGAEVDS